jgi:hypothetical protein
MQEHAADQKKTRMTCVRKGDLCKTIPAKFKWCHRLEKILEKWCTLRFMYFNHVLRYCCPWQHNDNGTKPHKCGEDCAAGREKCCRQLKNISALRRVELVTINKSN